MSSTRPPTFEEDFAHMVNLEIGNRTAQKESYVASLTTVKDGKRNFYALDLDYPPERLIKVKLAEDDADYVLFCAEAWGTDKMVECRLYYGGLIVNMPAEMRYETLMFIGLTRDGSKRKVESYKIIRNADGLAERFEKDTDVKNVRSNNF